MLTMLEINKKDSKISCKEKKYQGSTSLMKFLETTEIKESVIYSKDLSKKIQQNLRWIFPL